MNHVVVYDSTLRDGAQAQGVSFTVEDKLKIVQRLDELGVGCSLKPAIQVRIQKIWSFLSA